MVPCMETHEFHVALDPEHESEILPKQNLHLENELFDVRYCKKINQKDFIFSWKTKTRSEIVTGQNFWHLEC